MDFKRTCSSDTGRTSSPTPNMSKDPYCPTGGSKWAWYRNRKHNTENFDGKIHREYTVNRKDLFYPKNGSFRWVKYSTISGSNIAHLAPVNRAEIALYKVPRRRHTGIILEKWGVFFVKGLKYCSWVAKLSFLELFQALRKEDNYPIFCGQFSPVHLE